LSLLLSVNQTPQQQRCAEALFAASQTASNGSWRYAPPARPTRTWRVRMLAFAPPLRAINESKARIDPKTRPPASMRCRGSCTEARDEHAEAADTAELRSQFRIMRAQRKNAYCGIMK
jgi:hypothetical protein